MGKLNVVHAEGKDPRLVLDSTVCGVNPKCAVPERISLPMALDVRLAFLRTRTCLCGGDVLYHYRVCHFGARFSAYWWQRAGAFLLRLLHGILALRPHVHGCLWISFWQPASQ